MVFVVGKLVSQEHFGGFLESSNYEQVGGDKKSWKERMEELITKSKKEKVRKEKKNVYLAWDYSHCFSQ